MRTELSRREWLTGAAAAVGAGAAALPAAANDPAPKDPFGYMLNTSTIQGQNLSPPDQVEVAAKVGYGGIELWIRDLDKFAKGGGSLADLGQRIRDRGLRAESAIGFFEWVVDDDARRKQGLEEAKRSMDMVRQIGGKRVAAPPFGATNQTDLNLLKAAERYRALLEVGDQIGVVPQVEVWGFSKALGRLGETALVALECGHPKACVLADVYHLHKGGSGFQTLKLLSADALQVFHLNDYPADPGRDKITDAHRVYPGDGVAPLAAMLRDLRGLGFRGMLSLELFNRDYWKQDALEVARTGLEKMKAVVKKSLG